LFLIDYDIFKFYKMFVFVTQLLSNIQSAFYLLILSKEIVFVQTEKGSVLGDNVSKSECLATKVGVLRASHKIFLRLTGKFE
jgi:hypothetical protein